MDYEVVWTEPALDDFEAIVLYLARRSLSGAESVQVAILEHTDILANFPYIGPIYLGDPTGTTREVVCHSYRIFYRVDSDLKQVNVLSVWHAARGEPELPDNSG